MTATCPACGHPVRVEWTRYFRAEPSVQCVRCEAMLGTRPIAVPVILVIAIASSMLALDAVPEGWAMLQPPLAFWFAALVVVLLQAAVDSFGLAVRRASAVPSWSRWMTAAVLAFFGAWLFVALAQGLAANLG